MKRLHVALAFSPDQHPEVGTLVEDNRRVYFEYSESFIARRWELSPFRLSVRSGLIEHRDRDFGPLPGLFDDSLPDGWGLLLMDRYFRQRGLDPAAVSPLDRLAFVGNRGMGALTYRPADDWDSSAMHIDLLQLAAESEQIHSGQARNVLPELLRVGGSPAGARPKALIGLKGNEILAGESELPDGFEHWMVKFSAKKDPQDIAATEYAYALMAGAAGIQMTEVRLLSLTKGWNCFATKRFDRQPHNRRLHLHTFGNLVQANFRVNSGDYADLLKVTLHLTRNMQDVERAFRQMVFNIASHNRDDHAKNFSFLMNATGQWSLSPAYDLIYSDGPGGEHTMSILGEGRNPTRALCIKLAEQVGLAKKITSPIIDEVDSAVADWPAFADRAGCRRKTVAAVQSRLRPL